jgi:hypothetical protein
VTGVLPGENAVFHLAQRHDASGLQRCRHARYDALLWLLAAIQPSTHSLAGSVAERLGNGALNKPHSDMLLWP